METKLIVVPFLYMTIYTMDAFFVSVTSFKQKKALFCQTCLIKCINIAREERGGQMGESVEGITDSRSALLESSVASFSPLESVGKRQDFLFRFLITFQKDLSEEEMLLK